MNEIYYIEDDEAIAGMVKAYLEQRDYRVTVYATMEDARRAFLAHQPAAALVDWNLPDGDGSRLCQWIRSRWRELPLIFLTVRSDTSDIVSGFQNGADDYVVKPFELEVLYSRLRAVMRRTGKRSAAEQILVCDEISLDPEKMTVTCSGEMLPVSQSEYQLLFLLMSNKGRTVTRETILQQVWDSQGSYVNDNTLTVAMKRLREKLNQPSCIKTVRSFGYRMEDTV